MMRSGARLSLSRLSVAHHHLETLVQILASFRGFSCGDPLNMGHAQHLLSTSLSKSTLIPGLSFLSPYNFSPSIIYLI